MNIEKLRNKIPEVLAYARIIAKKNGHTGKYAKHIIALVIRHIERFTDKKLTEFMSVNEIGRILGYKLHFNHIIFSKTKKCCKNGERII